MGTRFNKADFTWDGMYLMYAGAYVGSKTFGEVHGVDGCHPTRVDQIKPAFIARFKYGYKPWKTWVNFLVKNVTVEQYLALANEIHPKPAMRALGYTRT